ncbi:DNA alkylation response protein [Pararhizobium mangrovi]|uniref:DNA alkylation response protein n=2 Tax=Pararhizobium mangrovi TaxID=2590452 RepID=A0A506TVP9_9HYPH|nr:DNA alkylation response protein [Pararhizobium mangrovi]
MPKSLREGFDAIGRFTTSVEGQDLARMANRSAPELRALDARGERTDQVEYHPAYHALMRRSVAAGLHCSVWENVPDEAGISHQARAVRFFLTAGLERGHLAAISTTAASVAAIAASPRVAKDWAPRVLTRRYDSATKPAMRKQGVTIGMAMTERQGGSDVEGCASTASRVGEGIYRLTGEKWFVGAPMSDAFVTLGRTEEGVSCFLVPRVLEDGAANGIELRRLKDMSGTRSNACVEMGLSQSYGFLLGTAGTGVRTILDMVTLTRLDCALVSAGLMRAALGEAVFHVRRRTVSGNPLAERPIMTRVLADLSLDTAAATALSLRLARSFDRARESREEAAYARLMTPVTKYWVCKSAPGFVSEAMECIGGSGYVEDRPIARHYRDAPASGLWEGTGNAMALDVLRVLGRGRELLDSVVAGIGHDLGPAGARTVDVLRAAIALAQEDEGAARMLTEQLALAAAAAELNRLGAAHIADAFAETRLAGSWRSTYGMLDSRFDAARILEVLCPDADADAGR